MTHNARNRHISGERAAALRRHPHVVHSRYLEWVDRPAVFTLTTMTDEQLMRFALNRAREAAQRGEVPVGALVVIDDAIVGEGFNQPIATHDPTAHAEIVALRQAAAAAGNYRLTGATMYVTIEPCQMCVGAMVHARIDRLVYGAPEPKAGAIESAMRAHEHPALNHRLTVTARVLEDECRDVLQEFFRDRRKEATEP